jgi:hypothetical protein
MAVHNSPPVCLFRAPGTDDLIAAFSWARMGEQILEVKMTTVKGLVIAALLVGGTSLALAQNGPATGGQPAVAGRPPAAPPAAPGPNLQAGTPSHHAMKHHKKMYMSAKSHKGSKITPAGTAKPQMKQ